MAFKLEWCEPRKPNASGIRYDHVLAESPIGLFSIEWKSWKDHPGYELYLDGEWLVDGGNTLDAAKDNAHAYMLKRANEMAETVKLVFGEATVTHTASVKRGNLANMVGTLASKPDAFTPFERACLLTARDALISDQEDAARIDFLKNHYVFASPGMDIRAAIDNARMQEAAANGLPSGGYGGK